MKNLRPWALTAVAAVVLAACGGGGSDVTPAAHITSVKVVGDSIADVGAFGFKFTVQGTASLTYPERIAQSYGLAALCSFYLFNGTTFVPNPAAGCTDYALGGGRINNFSAPTSPQSIPVQLATVGAGGNFGSGDLFVIDGGGNDAADLVGAYLKAATDSGASYSALLKTVLNATTVDTNLAAGPSGLVAVGGLYMTALADKFYDAIKVNVLDKGATHVLVLNMPAITKTPRFQMVLDSIAASKGGGATGATARAQAEAVFDGWIQAFNAQLATKVSGNSSVALFDFHQNFLDEVANPAQFGLSNVKTPACPVTSIGTDGLPVYDFPTCTATALSAAPPSGVTDPNWWQTYAFSDGFHPTPLAHKLLAQAISKTLATAGWL